MILTSNARIIQIHPSRRCNLRCLHCYSSSGPDVREELDVELLRRTITDASAEGYNVASFSGGEPMLYKPLRALLAQAHACGMHTTVTSNGMLLDERRIERVQGVLDLLAISLDGVPTSHNRMRASERAFETMLARLEGVRTSGIPFGFIFTLTQYNLHELDWVAAFALEQGAKLLQIHPLEEVGRAGQRLPGAQPDGEESAYAYLEYLRIREAVGDRMNVHLDLINRNQLREHPAKVFAGENPGDVASLPLAHLVTPLIVETSGEVVPLQYGFNRHYVLGNLYAAALPDLAARWRTERYPAFRQLCKQVFNEVTAPATLPFVNWYEAITRTHISA